MWAKMLDSSVWQTTKEVRLLWVTMLLMKDREGIVRAAIPGLAHRAVLTLEECEGALKILSDPDPYSTTATGEGRRIIKIAGGWQIVNHELYRCSDEARKEHARLRQIKHRDGQTKNSWKSKAKSGKTKGEGGYEKLEKSEASQAALDRYVSSTLPAEKA